jgi:parallel beta helix pectate lyase-like protein
MHMAKSHHQNYHRNHHHHDDDQNDTGQQAAPAGADPATNLTPGDLLLGIKLSDVMAAMRPHHAHDTSAHDPAQGHAHHDHVHHEHAPITPDALAHDVASTQPDQAPIQTTPVAPVQDAAQPITPDALAHDVASTQPDQAPIQTTPVAPVQDTAQMPPVDVAAHAPTPTPAPVVDAAAQPVTPAQPAQAAQPVNLTHSTTAIQSDHNGQVIENLDLYVDHGDAVTITNDNVVLRNCRIHYADGNGVSVSGANHVTIENCEIIDTAVPSGTNQGTAERDNILVQSSPNLSVHNVTVRDGSTGMYLLDSPGANISHVDGYDFHGPFPRGQFVQLDKSGDSSVSDFYVLNEAGKSSPEDIVSVYASPNTTVSNGVIDGNNSQTGVGVMFEGGSTGGRVTNVDALHQANGAFSSYDSNVVFDHTRSFDNIATDQGRGTPSSNALIWNVSSGGVSVTNSSYTAPANPNNIVWDASKAVVADVHQDAAATPMAHITNHYDWG